MLTIAVVATGIVAFISLIRGKPKATINLITATAVLGFIQSTLLLVWY